jgi:hypothetical protein
MPGHYSTDAVLAAAAARALTLGTHAWSAVIGSRDCAAFVTPRFRI